MFSPKSMSNLERLTVQVSQINGNITQYASFTKRCSKVKFRNEKKLINNAETNK
jgi:hypothetical protein